MNQQTLQQQNECDELVVELVVGMGNVLPFVDAMKDKAITLELKGKIIDMLHLIEDASHFVIEYKSNGAAGKCHVWITLERYQSHQSIVKCAPCGRFYAQPPESRWTSS